MELDVTHLLEEDCQQFSASMAEGFTGPETWNNSKENAEEKPLLTDPAHLDEARAFFGEFGIEGWGSQNDLDTNALLLQFIAGDIREMQSLFKDDIDGFKKASEDGTVSGRLYPGDDGKWYFSID